MMGLLEPAFLFDKNRHRASVDIAVTYEEQSRPINTYKWLAESHPLRHTIFSEINSYY
jgi:hypothetical protein